MEYFSLLVRLNQIITTMKLIFYYCLAVLSSQTIRTRLLCLLRVHRTDHLLPFYYRITLTSLCIYKNHHATLSTHHVPKYIFKIWFVFMFVIQIDNLLLKQLSLQHIFDDKLLTILNKINNFLQFLRLKNSIWFNECKSEGKIVLFGIEKHLIH